MLPRPGDRVTMLPEFVCFELKWLDADEFAHWSHTDFKAVTNARKRRDWQLFYALREGASLPDNVLRIESPDGTHVIEHLQQVYMALCRRDRTVAVPGSTIEAEDVRLSSANGRGSERMLLPAQDVAPVPQPTRGNDGIPPE
jgi:hypothetical protein